MSTSQIIIWIIVAILVITGIWGLWWYASIRDIPERAKPIPVTVQKKTPPPAKPVIGDTSDKAIDSVLTTIDAQIKALNTDTAGIDQNLK
jgi:hypothetical protein